MFDNILIYSHFEIELHAYSVISMLNHKLREDAVVWVSTFTFIATQCKNRIIRYNKDMWKPCSDAGL